MKSLRKHTTAFLDCHLMVTNPEDYVKEMADSGASQFTFHIESTGSRHAASPSSVSALPKSSGVSSPAGQQRPGGGGKPFSRFGTPHFMYTQRTRPPSPRVSGQRACAQGW